VLTLFFVPSLGSNNSIEVTGDEAHHAIKVLRISLGEEILLSDGAGAWARGSVERIDKKSFVLSVLERGMSEPAEPEIIVVQALTKSDRAKETIELLTVAGVSTIIPWEAERSIAKWQSDFGEKWFTASVTAAKQSRRLVLPQIEAPATTEQIARRFGSGKNLLVLHEEGTFKISDAAKALVPGPIILVVGPEGGISGNELGIFEASGAQIVKLGAEVLRAAHAGFAATAAISALIGRW